MIDENMPQLTETQSHVQEQGVRDSRITEAVSSASQFLVRLRSSISSRPINVQEVSLNLDTALERAILTNQMAEKSLRQVARIVNFLKANARGERNKNVAEAEKTNKVLFKIAFMVALSRILVSRIIEKTSLDNESTPEKKQNRFKTLLASAISIPMLGISTGAAVENATNEDVQTALRNENQTPITLNLDQDNLESANSFDEVQAKCEEIELLMAELQIQIPELNTSMASINIPDEINSQTFRADVEAEFQRVCEQLGIDGGDASELIDFGGEAEDPGPEDSPEAATMTAEQAIERLGEGEIVSRIELPHIVIETTAAHAERFGDTGNNMLLSDEDIPLKLKIDTITEMVRANTSEEPTAEQVEANIDYYIGLLSEIRIAIPAIDNMWVREGGPSDFITAEELMAARPRVIRIGDNFDGVTNEALVNRAENSPAVVEMYITSEGELVFIVYNEEITEKTPSDQLTNGLSIQEYSELLLFQSELHESAGIHVDDLTASVYYLLSQYIK